ncbi:hypothetical protein G7Z17_g446 [Cylindrodendrum hubeiense]|uniref:2-oxoadipate dioxygenase/decarboxylase n=1 Tax=Cylindrodendrum hubeiense TaxID=595255 RepID=A0A9P5HL72_9HYPO|nr:hypothetical protein G7Z17_g446 [Cylindrodendrum hubeiense]
MASFSNDKLAGFVDADELRTKFALAMSAMYRAEVPLYGDLINIVRAINEKTLDEDSGSKPKDFSAIRTNSERLTLERHGAIRLGTPYELQTVRRIFGVLGMYPIGYYDLSVAGLPMHATCFRPREVSSLDRNPFRVFTTLLRPELLVSEEARNLSLELLGQREIFTDKLLEMLSTAELQNGRLTEPQAEVFIPEALLTFSWRPVAAATFSQYNVLKAEHPILADVACFQGAHINHLTPRTLDISAAQVAMQTAGMAVKSRIEGPPRRKCPILLRQTSFLALEESVKFRTTDSTGDTTNPLSTDTSLIEASHKARFGEIEERGAAVTIKGRELYDRLLSEGMSRAVGVSPGQLDSIMEERFKEYPDDWTTLRRERLIYCEFQCTEKNAQNIAPEKKGTSLLEQLITDGVVEATPITYEDFLPFSAVGIFQSNLQSRGADGAALVLKQAAPDLKGLEDSIQTKLMDVDEWYGHAQTQSLKAVCAQLELTMEDLT